MIPNSCHPSGAQNFEWFLDFWKICALLPWTRGDLVQRATSTGIFLPLNKTSFLNTLLFRFHLSDKKLEVQNKKYFC
jgi:hypothetical protein